MNTRRLSQILAALVALAVATTSCGGSTQTGSASGPKASQVPAATLMSGSAAASAAAKASKQAEAIQSRRAQATSTAKASPQGTPAPPPPPAGEASPSDPPVAGNYTYSVAGTVTSQGKTEQLPKEASLKIDPATLADGGAKRQVHHISAQGGGSDVTYLFASDGIYIEQVVNNNYTCALQPPLKALPLPLKVGAKWTAKSTCQGTTTDMTGEILRTEKRTIGGAETDTFVVKSSVHTYGAGFDQQQDGTSWFSPDYRLRVREQTHVEMTFGAEKVTSDSVQELTRLTPAK